MPEPLRSWTEEELRREFRFMSPPERLFYRDLVADLKPDEARPLHAASLAVEAVQRKRRYEGAKHLLDQEGRTLGNKKDRTRPWLKAPAFWPRAYRQGRSATT